jgi:hypothetical protein
MAAKRKTTGSDADPVGGLDSDPPEPVPRKLSRRREISKPPGKPGRPSKYSQRIADEICQRMALGELLGAICRDIGIDRSTVWAWQKERPDFAKGYAQARELMADAVAEDVLNISDDSKRDIVDGKPDWEAVQRSRLRADSRKWFCARISQRWREKAGVEISTPPDQPFEISKPMTPKEVAVYVGNLLTAAEIAIGLKPDDAVTSDADRLKRIVEAGEPLPVDLYNALIEAPIDGRPN